MQIVRTTPQEYKSLFPNPSHVFNSVEFNELNRHKCDDVHYLVIKDDKGKVRFGIILGQKGNMLKSPFSAPFGGMEERGVQRLSYYIESIDALRGHAENIGKKICITLPPAIYDNATSAIAAQFQAILSQGGRILYSDYNYHYELNRFVEFKDYLWANTKRNLASAIRQDFDFEFSSYPSDQLIREIYNIIYENHTGLGYPVHMSVDDIIATSKIFDMDFFLVKKEGIGVAAAIIYHTSSNGVQLIYWGDKLDYRSLRPMNFLAYKVIEYYYNKGVTFYDLGPSSSSGIPSFGLCDFKASLGCALTPKYTLEL